MPTDMNSQILKAIRALSAADRPATFNDLARQFGVTAPLISSLSRQLVAKGLAEPCYVDIRGVRTMYGLMPQPAATPAA